MTGIGAPAFLDSVREYYTEALRRHGATPRGVDWNSDRSQELRFAQLRRLLPAGGPFTLNDVGCGYGGLLAYLRNHGVEADYLGIDISPAMIDAARPLAASLAKARFICAGVPDRRADYAVASGLFNVRLDIPEADWRSHVLSTLDALNAQSSRGFAFNCLSTYSDIPRRSAHLHYADPVSLFDHCKRSYSADVALLHDYGLFEFTMIVRKAATHA